MNYEYRFHYEVRFKLLVSDEDNNIRTEKFKKVFNDNLPLKSREEAFKAFNNYLSFLKENNRLEKNELDNFSISIPTPLQNRFDDLESLTLNSEFYQEIGVYLVFEEEKLLDIVDKEGLVMFSQKLNKSEAKQREIEKDIVREELKKKYKSNHPLFLDVEDIEDEDIVLIEQLLMGIKDFRYKDECLIHSVNSEEVGQFWREREFAFPLQNEYKIYQYYDIDVSGYLTEAVYWENKEVFFLLKTPFNWRTREMIDAELDNENNDLKISENNTSTEDDWYLNRIEKGESINVEFKFKMFHNAENRDFSLKTYVTKTICGFLNTRGGLLFLGVNDNNTITGLDEEFSFLNSENQKDVINQKIDTTLQNHFSTSITPLINWEIRYLNKKKVVVFDIKESHEPVFVKYELDGNPRYRKKTFYYRTPSSTRKIEEVDDIVKYVFNKKWKIRPINE